MKCHLVRCLWKWLRQRDLGPAGDFDPVRLSRVPKPG
nr:MAG TPA: hypothetical protein [Caudoviricetes sp.]